MSEEKYYLSELINHRLIRFIIKLAPLLSLIITNFIASLIFSYFFKVTIKDFYFWILFTVSFLFSLIIIKTNYILHFKKEDKKLKKENKKTESFKTPNLGLFNSTVILIKNLFFNMLNDLFILTVIWTAIIFVLYSFGLVSAPNNFTNLATVLTLIGVLSGFFQLYIKNYKEQVFLNMTDSLTQYLINSIKKISLADFLDNIKEKDKKDKIKRILSDKVELKSRIPGFRPSPTTVVCMPFIIKDISVFDNIDYLIKEGEIRDKDINWENLNKLYKEYFDKKLEDFKNEVKTKNLVEIRKLIFSHLIFFDEVVANLEKTNLEFSNEDKDKLEGFNEHYQKFTYDCIFYVLDVLLNFKENEENDQTTNKNQIQTN